MSDRLVIFGNTTMARMAHYYFTHDSPYEVAAFTVDAEYADGDAHLGLPLVAFEEVQEAYPPEDFDLFVATGYRRLNRVRREKVEAARAKGYRLPSYVSSRATVWDAFEVGDNGFILEDVTVQPFVRFGDNVFVWSGCHFGHDVAVGDHCFFSSHVVACGHVTIGPHCFIGGNVFLRDGVQVAEENIVGAQAVILHDTKRGQVFVTSQTEPYRLDAEQFVRLMDISGP